MSQDQNSSKIVAEALSWVGTPYHYGQCQKGVGVDCARFALIPYKVAGIIPDGATLPAQHSDWILGKKVNRYAFRDYILRWADEVPYDTRQPGDLVTFIVGGVESHCGILVTKDDIVHAVSNSCVRQQRLMKVGSLKAVYRAKNGQ